MIKRYILHIEAHKNIFRYPPRISFKRAPRAGDRVKDGGVMGTLRLCPTCEEGFLHQPDPATPPKVRRRKPYRPTMLERVLADLSRNLVENAVPPRPARSFHTPRPAMDFNSHVELEETPTRPVRPVYAVKPSKHVEIEVDEPVEHVELEVKEETKAEHVEIKETKDTAEHVEIKTDEESPEELELDYTLGNRKYVPSDRVWTRKAWYIVEKLENEKLYLVREDIWKEREKKAKHVELETKDEPEEPSGEIVVLDFN